MYFHGIIFIVSNTQIQDNFWAVAPVIEKLWTLERAYVHFLIKLFYKERVLSKFTFVVYMQFSILDDMSIFLPSQNTSVVQRYIVESLWAEVLGSNVVKPDVNSDYLFFYFLNLVYIMLNLILAAENRVHSQAVPSMELLVALLFVPFCLQKVTMHALTR